MKTLLVLASLMNPAIAPTTAIDSQTKIPDSSTKLAVMCFSKGEQTSGMNKICYYDCLGSTVAINVESYQLCPISINR